MRAILACREIRVQRREELQRLYRLPAVQLTMNVPGAQKTDPLFDQAQAAGESELKKRCNTAGLKIVYSESRTGACGRESVFLLQAEADQLKRLCVRIEAEHKIGRVFDFDVFSPDGRAIDRVSLGVPQRKCFICNKPARECARQQTHSVDQLVEYLKASISGFFYRTDG